MISLDSTWFRRDLTRTWGTSASEIMSYGGLSVQKQGLNWTIEYSDVMGIFDGRFRCVWKWLIWPWDGLRMIWTMMFLTIDLGIPYFQTKAVEMGNITKDFSGGSRIGFSPSLGKSHLLFPAIYYYIEYNITMVSHCITNYRNRISVCFLFGDNSTENLGISAPWGSRSWPQKSPIRRFVGPHGTCEVFLTLWETFT